MEIDVAAVNIDHYGSIVRNIDEFEINATVMGRGKIRTFNVENLHGRDTVALEGDELLIVFYTVVIDNGGGVVVIDELVTDRISIAVVILVSVDRIFWRHANCYIGTCVRYLGQRLRKFLLDIVSISRIISAIHTFQRI